MKRLLLPLLIVCCVHTSSFAQGSLVISELLYQPVSGEAEYVELYNHGSAAVQLSDYHIVRVLHDTLSTHYPLPDYLVPPHGYVALSKEISSVAACFPIAPGAVLLQCTLPTYPNSGGSVVLSSADSTVVDRFDYAPSMHSRLLRDKAGVSLERRSFERPTNDPSNWFSAASTAGYGTPGYANSQSTETLAEKNAFTLSSTLLSPDNDGYQDILTIDYQLNDGGLAARAEVYDNRGRMVRRLLNNELVGTAGTLTWDGLGDNSSRLPQGQYILQITLYNLEGTQQTLRYTVALVTSR